MVDKVGAKKVKLLHNQDVAMSIVALACGAKPKTFVNHLSIMFPDMVKKEQMKNQDKSKELSDMIPYQWNKRAAKLVGHYGKIFLTSERLNARQIFMTHHIQFGHKHNYHLCRGTADSVHSNAANNL